MIGNTKRSPDRYGTNSNGVYQAVVSANDLHGGMPQMGFTVHRKNGGHDACFYHSLLDVAYSADQDGEYLTLTHGAKIFTLRGRHLGAISEELLNHTLIALHQHDGAMPGDQHAPFIQDIWVTTLNERRERE